jgi:hypothetical protein
MNRLEKAAGFGSMMGKQAGLFWKKLDKPVGIKSQWGPHNGVTEMRLDAERTMEPRLLTRLFSSPEKDYDHLFSVMKDMAEHEDSELSSTPMGRAMFASHLLPKWYPDRYKQEGDSPIGNEDVFEDSVYPAFSSQLKAPPTTPMTAKKAAAFGAMMGKLAAGDTWTAPNAGDFLPKGNQPAQQPRYTADNLPRPAPIDGKAYSYRENDIYKTRQDMHRKADAVRFAAGAYGPGTATGTIREGVVVQPGATFTPQGQQPASNNIDWSSVTTQGGVQGNPQAATSTPMQRWNQRVSEHHKAQALKDKGTDREIQSSSYTNPNAASFLPKPGSNIQNSPAPTNVAPKPASSPVIESKSPKRLF